MTTGEARIKPEFVKLNWEAPSDVVANTAEGPSDAAAIIVAEAPVHRKKERGQNKFRPVTKSFDTVRLCRAFIDSACKDGEACKFSHDIKLYMESKPEDIGPNCYIYDSFGFCKYGVQCRYASSHVDANHNNMKKDDYHQKSDAAGSFRLSGDAQKRIRQMKSNGYGARVAEALECTSKRAALNVQISKEMQALSALKIDGIPTEDQDFTPKLFPEDKKLEVAEHLAKIENLNLQLVNERLSIREKKSIDFRGKTYLAPLTTVGNLPFRRICKSFGVDITCGEMAMADNLIKGQNHEWALTRRHQSEDIFGIQIAGSDANTLSKASYLINEYSSVDFVDLNLGCPIDGVVRMGAGSALLGRQGRLDGIVQSMSHVLDVPLTLKIRTGLADKKRTAHKLVEKFRDWSIPCITLHGRTQQARYSKLADWEYIKECSEVAAASKSPMAFFGNGDVIAHEEYWNHLDKHGVNGVMIGRGALQKPWIFQEIKERKVWDISSNERLDILKQFSNYGLEHWGSDTVGVNTCRRYLCEWLSHLYRYIPVGILESARTINQRAPAYQGRNELETLMASPNAKDWVKISEMILGKAPDDFSFVPKHKSSAWDANA